MKRTQMARRLPKPRDCRHCGQEFQPNWGQGSSKACSINCAIALQDTKKERDHRAQVKAQEKAARAKLREDKARVRPMSKIKSDAQDAFNAFIRERDSHLPCISCGLFEAEPIAGCLWDCGHFLSIGSHIDLRFNEDNAHRQHSRCNRGAAKSGHNDRVVSQDYREFLVQRIGLERVTALEGPYQILQLRREDYLEITKHYKAKLKELRNGN